MQYISMVMTIFRHGLSLDNMCCLRWYSIALSSCSITIWNFFVDDVEISYFSAIVCYYVM